jgi:hypothetical protein
MANKTVIHNKELSKQSYSGFGYLNGIDFHVPQLSLVIFP